MNDILQDQEVRTPQLLNETNVSTVDEDLNNLSLGSRLKHKRESLNMTLESIAKELHLSQSMIKKIEAEQYAEIGGFTFVRGYLRTYAKLLGLSADEIVKAFNSLGLKEKESSREKFEFQKKPVKRNSYRVFWYSTASIILILITLIIWWVLANSNASLLAVKAETSPDNAVKKAVTNTLQPQEVNKPLTVSVAQQEGS